MNDNISVIIGAAVMPFPKYKLKHFKFDLQRFANTETFEGGVYTLTTDKGTLKLSGLKNYSNYCPTFDEANNLVEVQRDAVAVEGTLTVVENSTDYAIKLQGQKFTLVGSNGDDRFIFNNVEPNVTIKYTVDSGGNDLISKVADVNLSTVKLQFVTNDNKPVAYSTKWSGNNLIVTVGDNTITYVNFGAGNVSVDNGVGLETIDGLNVNVDETGNGYYEISSAADLKILANYVNNNGTTSGKVFKLTGDIDLSGSDFAGIGAFSGTFDGNGFTIRNLTIGGSNSYVGLFAYNSGTIQMSAQSSATTTASSRTAPSPTSQSAAIIRSAGLSVGTTIPTHPSRATLSTARSATVSGMASAHSSATWHKARSRATTITATRAMSASTTKAPSATRGFIPWQSAAQTSPSTATR